MLGVDAAASQQADKQNKLATVAKQQGKAVEAPPPGPDYAVSYFKARSGALADELADGIDASAVERLAPCARNDKKKTSCYAPGNWESELRAIREAIEPGGVRSAVAVSGSGNRRPPKRWSAGPTRPRRTAASSASGATGNMPRNRRTSSCVRSISPRSPRRSLGASPRPSTSTRLTPTPAAPDARGLVSRLAWGVTAIVFIGLWTAAILMVAWQLWTLPTGFAFGTLGVGVVLAVGVGWGEDHYTPGAETFALLGPILQRLEHDAHTAILPLSRVFDAMTTSAIVLLLLAALATTWKATHRRSRIGSRASGPSSTSPRHSSFSRSRFSSPCSTPGRRRRWSTRRARPGRSAPRRCSRAGLAGAVFSVALMIVDMPAVSVLRAVARENVGPTAETLLQQHGASDSGTQLFLLFLQGLAPLLRRRCR